MNPNPPNPFVEALIRNYKLIVGVVAGLILLNLLFGYAFLSVSVGGDRAEQAKLSLYQNTEKKTGLRKGLNLVKRGEYSLRADTDKEQTEVHVEVKRLRMNRADINLSAQRAIKKIFSGSQGCVFGDSNLATDQTVYSYNCNGPKTISRYSFVDKPVVGQLFNQRIYAGTSYKNGLLGLVAGLEGTDDELRMAHVSSSKITPLAFIGNPTISAASYTVIPTTKADGSDGDAFVMADTDKRELVYFKNLSDTQPQKLPMESGDRKLYATGRDNAVFVLGTRPVLVDADKDKKLRGKDEGDPHDQPGGTIKQYSIEGDTLKETATIELPEDLDMSSFQAISRDTLIVKNLNGATTIYRLNGSDIKLYDKIETTDALVPYKNGFVFRRGLDYLSYNVDTRQSQLLYRLDNLTPTTLQNVNGQITLGAFLKNSSTQYTFALLDTPREDKEMHRLLSYPTGSSRDLLAIDYNDKYIYAEFALKSFVSDRRTGQLTFDETEVANKRSRLTEQLKNDGIDMSKYTLINR